MSIHTAIANKIVTVHRAGDIGNNVIIRPCLIAIGDAWPEGKSLEQARMNFDLEAMAIAGALHDHLPQATLDRVLVRLMEYRVRETLYIGAAGS